MNKTLIFKALIITLASFRFIHTHIDPSKLNHFKQLQAHAETKDITPQFRKDSVRVGIQVGHWKNEEVPAELYSIKGNTGAQATNGYTELQSNMAIAHAVSTELTKRGIAVDILPTTVPAGYNADAFITIHADGSHRNETSGYKIAPYAKDATGSASLLSTMIDSEYKHLTGMARNSMITNNMTHYYAFSADRFNHAVSSTTPAVIVETGFITSTQDQDLLVHNTHIPASGIAQGILDFIIHSRPETMIQTHYHMTEKI